MSIIEIMIGAGLAGIAALLLDVAVSGGGGVSPLEVVSELALVIVLGSYLYYRHWQRTRHLPVEPKCWDGKGFDASGISPKIARVRENPLGEKHAPESHYHRSLLAFAREAVSRLGFFADRSQTNDH